MTIRVTVRDLDDPDLRNVQEQDISDDYLLICAGRVYLAHTNAFRNGTHVLTIKREPREVIAEANSS